MPMNEVNLGPPILEVRRLTRYFPAAGAALLSRAHQVLKAVDDVSFALPEGRTFGLVGESGCGKSTLGRAILRLIEPTSGEILYLGRDIVPFQGGELRALRRHMQMVFQDPYSSLDPRMRIESIIREPLDIFGLGSRPERRRRVAELLDLVGLDES